jgi:hypothetical protein
MNGTVVSMNSSYENSVKGKLTKSIVNNAEMIAKALMEGKDVEIRKTANGISVSKVRKTIIVR